MTKEWKEELHKLYPRPAEPSSFWEMGMKGVEAFIEKVRQEAIMEVINELPDGLLTFVQDEKLNSPQIKDLKDQLKSKFANKI